MILDIIIIIILNFAAIIVASFIIGLKFKVLNFSKILNAY